MPRAEGDELVTLHHCCATARGQRPFCAGAGLDGAPSELLTHGSPAGSFLFRVLILLLVSCYRTTVPDHLGFGVSGTRLAHELERTFDALAAPSIGLLEQLSLDGFEMYVQDHRVLVAWRLTPLVSYESGFAPRWYVPRADVGLDALTLTEGRTFRPYKGFCSYYTEAGHPGIAWPYENPSSEVRCIADLVSFEPHELEVGLDGTLLLPEPEQTVQVQHVDCDFTLGEALRRLA